MANQNYSKNSFLDDYVGVDELIEQMNQKYPDGILISEPIDISDNHVVFKTTFHLNGHMKCTGHARVEKTPNNPHWFEKCETKSRGRCLRVLLSAGVTKEEMEDVNISATNLQTVEQTNNPVEPNSAIEALKDIQQSVRGGELLKLINETLIDIELNQVTTLDAAKNFLDTMGEADATLFAATISKKYANI